MWCGAEPTSNRPEVGPRRTPSPRSSSLDSGNSKHLKELSALYTRMVKAQAEYNRSRILLKHLGASQTEGAQGWSVLPRFWPR